MKRIFFRFSVVCSLALFIAACGGSGQKDKTTASEPSMPDTVATATAAESANPAYDPNRGEGKFHDVKLSDRLDAPLAATGEKTYSTKCQSCHKLTDERLVGPGWKGVTSRHRPEWIMNFVTNTDNMLDKDPKAQAMLEICMVRMPDQNLTDEEARGILEFMRKNDGVR